MKLNNKELLEAIEDRGKWWHHLFVLHPDGAPDEREEQQRQNHLSNNFSPIKHTPQSKWRLRNK